PAPGARRAPPRAGGARLLAGLTSPLCYWAVQVTAELVQLKAPASRWSVPSTRNVPLACPAGSNEPGIEPLPPKTPLESLTVNPSPQFLAGSNVQGSAPNEIEKFGMIPVTPLPWHVRLTVNVRFVMLFRSEATSKAIDLPWDVVPV